MDRDHYCDGAFEPVEAGELFQEAPLAGRLDLFDFFPVFFNTTSLSGVFNISLHCLLEFAVFLNLKLLIVV